MTMKVLVCGGTGLVGSAICKLGVKRGWQMTSISRRGQAFKTPSGHSPGWVNEVEWRSGTPFDTASYAPLLASSSAVITTLGVLLERPYKSSSGVVNPLAVLGNIVQSALGDKGNPLEKGRSERSYETMNRDAALAIFRAYKASQPITKEGESPFVYISAEDIFRPFIDERYISTKREAESIISLESNPSLSDETYRSIRPVFIRPSMIYHPHLSPLSTLPATALDLSSQLQSLLPAPLRFSSSTTSLSPSSPLSSLGNLLSIPPIHVDTVAEAVCKSIEQKDVRGVVGVREMRRWKGFGERWDHQQDIQRRRGEEHPSTAT